MPSILIGHVMESCCSTDLPQVGAKLCFARCQELLFVHKVLDQRWIRIASSGCWSCIGIGCIVLNCPHDCSMLTTIDSIYHTSRCLLMTIYTSSIVAVLSLLMCLLLLFLLQLLLACLGLLVSCWWVYLLLLAAAWSLSSTDGWLRRRLVSGEAASSGDEGRRPAVLSSMMLVIVWLLILVVISDPSFFH